MGDATETLVRSGRGSEALATDGRSSAKARSPVGDEVATRGAVGLATVRREEQWCSTLDQNDLTCLLKVIESQLIPQLMDSYSPARGLPHR